MLVIAFQEGQFAAAGQPAIEGYADYAALSESVKKLATGAQADAAPAAGPQVTVESLGRTLGGREIWLVKIARGKADDKPAILVVGNVHAPHLVGSELALRLAQLLAAGKKETGAEELLNRCAFYIIPGGRTRMRARRFSSNRTSSGRRMSGRPTTIATAPSTKIRCKT